MVYVKITFCGGAGEVGASCILVKIDGKNILLDCGIRMKKGKDNLPDFKLIQDEGGVDAVIVSHAHMDHTGALPVISREYPEARIYMTHMTKGLVRVLLYDSLKIMEKGEVEIPIYAEKHVLDMLDRALCYSPQYTFKPFNDKDIKVTFYQAGHIAGAVMAFVEGDEGSLLYTGDISGTDQKTVNGATLPKLRPDVLIMETTYGDKLHSNRQVEEQRLIDSVKSVVDSGGKVLIPAFALGRAQEVILTLKKAMSKKELPKFDVYVDGMVKDINRVYKLYPNYLRRDIAKRVFKGTDVFYNDNIKAVENKDMRKEVLNSKEPLCVISSSGMLTGGPSASYAEKFAKDERNFIAITGYQDEEAPGREIIELMDSDNDDREITINGKKIKLNCGIGKYGLSAHSDKGELLGIINRTTPKNIMLVHGDRTITENFGKWVSEEVDSNVYVPISGETFDFSIEHKRKQLGSRDEIRPLNEESDMTDESVEKLWKHIRSSSRINRGYSIEELLKIWSGEDSFTEEVYFKAKDIMNESRYFSPDPRRLFLFKPVEEDDLAEEDDGCMEVNEMLKFVDDLFPEESYLYKKGARQDEKKALLFFSFPKKAEVEYSHLIEKVEKETGWAVEINKECNQIEAESLIISLLPKGVSLGKFSYFKEEGQFVIELSGRVSNFEEISARFLETTGLDINLKSKAEAEKIVKLEPVDAPHKMEQNKAFKAIEKEFKFKPHKLYKKGKKVSDGIEYIEISFITQEIGQRYSEELKRLESEIGWNILVGENPNQNEIIKIAKEICGSFGIAPTKNPSVMISEKQVKVRVGSELDEGTAELCNSKMLDRTGYQMVIEFKIGQV